MPPPVPVPVAGSGGSKRPREHRQLAAAAPLALLRRSRSHPHRTRIGRGPAGIPLPDRPDRASIFKGAPNPNRNRSDQPYLRVETGNGICLTRISQGIIIDRVTGEPSRFWSCAPVLVCGWPCPWMPPGPGDMCKGKVVGTEQSLAFERNVPGGGSKPMERWRRPRFTEAFDGANGEPKSWEMA